MSPVQSIEQMPEFWGNGLRHACIIGLGSDIGRELARRLSADGYEVWGTHHKDLELASFVEGVPRPEGRWDLLIFAAGTMQPIGKFFTTDVGLWESAVRVNALGPLRVLRSLWPSRKHDFPAVVFLGGPNLTRDTPTYSAYRAGKAMLAALVGTLQAEYPECLFRILNPGVVRTKLHKQTLIAGSNAANYERALGIVQGDEPAFSHDEVYAKLQKLLERSRA